MNKIAIIAAALLAAACDAGSAEHLVTASCTPVVNVTVPKFTPKKNARPRSDRTEAVQVYWDVSRSMREFAVHRRAGQSSDLEAVVGALDSNVLLQAHAKVVEQYGVGDSIAPLPSARSALSPNANRTVLHLAAEQIGSALAGGTAQAVLVVSDLEVDTPPRNARNATVCGGVPLPSTPEAGSLFGRCFENAITAVDGPPLTRTNLLVHVFRKSSNGRELFILLLATDRDFGRRISDEVVRRIGFERQVIFDSGAVAAANVRGCRLAAPAEEMLRTANGCAVKCYDVDGGVQAECDIQRIAGGAWISPVASAGNGVSYAAQKGDRATVSFVIPCTARPGVFDASVAYAWRIRMPWTEGRRDAFAPKATVRDLFDSLADAIVRIVAPRTLRIGIRLQ